MDLIPFQAELFPADRPQASLTIPVSMMALGGRFDFAGGMSLMIPTQQRATVKVAQREDAVLQIYLASGPHAQHARLPLSLLRSAMETPRELSIRIQQETGSEMVLPFVAVLRELHQQHGWPGQGLDLWLSWSHGTALYPALRRALQTALIIALSRHTHLGLEGQILPLTAWRAARRHGDPAGPQDFLANFYQKTDHLLPITAGPAQTYSPLPIPGGPFPISIQWQQQAYHPDQSYALLRGGCAIGYALIARARDASHEDLAHAREHDECAHLPLEGQLCQLSVAEFEQRIRAQLPEQLTGDDFLRMNLPLADPWVRIHPYRSYPVRMATASAVYTNERQSHGLGLIRQLTRQPDRATYAQLRYSFTDMQLADQPLAPPQRCVNDLHGQLDALKARPGVIGLIPVRAAWEQAHTLWLERPLDRATAEQVMASLPDSCQFAWLPAHPAS